MKFGGTSVGNAERMKNVAEIVAEHAQRAEVVVVVSAMGGVTDMLIRAANEASQRRPRELEERAPRTGPSAPRGGRSASESGGASRGSASPRRRRDRF